MVSILPARAVNADVENRKKLLIFPKWLFILVSTTSTTRLASEKRFQWNSLSKKISMKFVIKKDFNEIRYRILEDLILWESSKFYSYFESNNCLENTWRSETLIDHSKVANLNENQGVHVNCTPSKIVWN